MVWYGMQILLYNWFVCSNVRIVIKKESWNADLTVQLVRLLKLQDFDKKESWNADLTIQLVPLLKPQDLDKRGELECRSYFTTGSSAQMSGL